MSRRGRHGRHAHSGQARDPVPAAPPRAPRAAAEAPAPARAEDRAPRRRGPGPAPGAASPTRPRPDAVGPPRPVAAAAAAPDAAGAAPASAPAVARSRHRTHRAAGSRRVATAPVPGPGDRSRGRASTARVPHLHRRPAPPVHQEPPVDPAPRAPAPVRHLTAATTTSARSGSATTTLFIGLPPAESRLMAELLSGGDVGYELSLDPGAPIVVGVYPMRPGAARLIDAGAAWRTRRCVVRPVHTCRLADLDIVMPRPRRWPDILPIGCTGRKSQSASWRRVDRRRNVRAAVWTTGDPGRRHS